MPYILAPSVVKFLKEYKQFVYVTGGKINISAGNGLYGPKAYTVRMKEHCHPTLLM